MHCGADESGVATIHRGGDRLRAFLCAAVAAASIPGSTAAMAKDYTIVVSAPNRTYREAPVTFRIDAPRDFAGVALFDKNVPVPVQARLVDGKALVTFIFRNLCRGANTRH